MSSFLTKTILVFFFLVGLIDLQTTAWAKPSAKDILQSCKNSTQVKNNTQHLFYRNTTIILKSGEAPTTMTQTTEIFKKKPNYFKMVTNDGIQQRVVISNGDGYLYVQDNSTGKFQPIKSPINIDPFQQMTNSLDDFDNADAQPVTDASDPPGKGHYEVTVHRGKLPKIVDQATMKIDPQTNTVTHMEGKDIQGNKVLSMDATYQKIGNTYHPQHMHTESHTNNFDVSSDMDVVTNEVDKGIPDSTFAIK